MPSPFNKIDKKKVKDPIFYIEEIDGEWIPLFIFQDEFQIAI